jgi:hypothetical protein
MTILLKLVPSEFLDTLAFLLKTMYVVQGKLNTYILTTVYLMAKNTGQRSIYKPVNKIPNINL